MQALERSARTGEALSGKHKLLIGGEDFTALSREITVSFSPEGGGSELTFEPGASLRGLEDAPIGLYLGYGSLVPYFAGKLKRIPQRGGDFFGRTAKALGPFSEMSGQFFGETVRYSGISAARALQDVLRRASFPSGAIQIRGGGQRIEDLLFYEEVSLQEGAKAVMDTASMVGGDVPGPYGSRLLIPRPRPAATGKAKARFTERDYPQGGFTVTERHDAPHSRVVVFRRNENGTNAVREFALVPGFEGGKYRPPKNRIYYVPEFAGDAAEARQTAYDTARSLASGEVDFALEGVPIDETLTRYDSIQCERLDERKDGTYREVYACQMDGPLKVSVPGFSMDISGSALMLSETKVAAPRIYLPGVSAGVIGMPPGGLEPREDLTPAEDLTPRG